MDVIKTVIFDLDDTLIECGKYYYERIDAFIDIKNKYTKLDKEFCKNIYTGIDAQSRSVLGVSPHRFPNSIKAASLALDVLGGVPLDIKSAETLSKYAATVFDCQYEPFEETYEILNKLLGNVKLILYTLGDNSIQQKKVRDNKFHLWFPPDCIHYVSEKNYQVLNSILSVHKLNPEETLLVGDNYRGEIQPAYELKMPVAYIDRNKGKRWTNEFLALEREFSPICNLRELFDIYIFGGTIPSLT